MRAITGRRALKRSAASPQTISRFETEIPAREENIEAPSSINHAWVSRAVSSTDTKKMILDMESSESPVHGNQEAPPTMATTAPDAATPLLLQPDRRLKGKLRGRGLKAR
jgi:hypothetical protein